MRMNGPGRRKDGSKGRGNAKPRQPPRAESGSRGRDSVRGGGSPSPQAEIQASGGRGRGPWADGTCCPSPLRHARQVRPLGCRGAGERRLWRGARQRHTAEDVPAGTGVRGRCEPLGAAGAAKQTPDPGPEPGPPAARPSTLSCQGATPRRPARESGPIRLHKVDEKGGFGAELRSINKQHDGFLPPLPSLVHGARALVCFGLIVVCFCIFPTAVKWIPPFLGVFMFFIPVGDAAGPLGTSASDDEVSLQELTQLALSVRRAASGAADTRVSVSWELLGPYVLRQAPTAMLVGRRGRAPLRGEGEHPSLQRM